MSYNYQGDLVEDFDEPELSLQETNKHCMKCYYQKTCKTTNESLVRNGCGYKSTFKWVWRPADSGNATCTKCNLLVICDTGFCPDCGGETKMKWKKVKKWR